MKFPEKITFTDYLGKSFEFETLETLKVFFKNQYGFWSAYQDLVNQNPTVSPIVRRADRFEQILSTLDSWSSSIESWDVMTFRNNFANNISNLITQRWLWSFHPFIQKWIELNEISANVADAFFEAIVLKTTSRFGSGIDYFQGYLIAYEYINQNNTNINNRRNSEKKSLLQLRDQLSEKHNQLITDTNIFQTDLTVWKNDVINKHKAWFDKQVSLLDDTLLMHSKNFHEQLAVWTNQHLETNNQFREKLRFEGAASYWGDKVKAFRKQGYWWGGALFSSLVIGIGLFSKYFLAWLDGQPTGLGIQSIEGVVIFATVLSSFAFLIKSLSKLTFSAFHLQRDAEEREQLTHLYLSLRDSAHDDTESRKIILQALFSRSDTGLLAGDHSPTMPSIQDVIRVGKV